MCRGCPAIRNYFPPPLRPGGCGRGARYIRRRMRGVNGMRCRCRQHSGVADLSPSPAPIGHGCGLPRARGPACYGSGQVSAGRRYSDNIREADRTARISFAPVRVGGPVDYGGRELAASRSPYPAPFCWYCQITGHSPPKPRAYQSSAAGPNPQPRAWTHGAIPGRAASMNAVTGSS